MLSSSSINTCKFISRAPSTIPPTGPPKERNEHVRNTLLRAKAVQSQQVHIARQDPARSQETAAALARGTVGSHVLGSGRPVVRQDAAGGRNGRPAANAVPNPLVEGRHAGVHSAQDTAIHAPGGNTHDGAAVPR